MTTMKRVSAPALILLAVAVAIAAVVLSLGSAGGSQAATPSADPVPAPTTAAAPVAADRSGDTAGQMYLDDTEARRGEMVHAYNSCLLSNGAQSDTASLTAAYAGDHPAVAIKKPVPAAATAACADLEMKQPKPLDPALNPDYAADAAANVTCLRDHGILVHQVTSADSDVPAGMLWTYDTSTTATPDDAAQIETSCLSATFGR